jgi:hypothetical protein
MPQTKPAVTFPVILLDTPKLRLVIQKNGVWVIEEPAKDAMGDSYWTQIATGTFKREPTGRDVVLAWAHKLVDTLITQEKLPIVQ